MNKDKVIKDLRERNDKLQSQYYMSESRCYYAQHRLDQVIKLKIAKDKVYSELEDKYITEKAKNQKAIEIYENKMSIEYKQKRFMEGKTTADLMYEALQGDDNV